MPYYDRHEILNELESAHVPRGKRLADEKITMLFMGKLTISVAMFNSYFDIAREYLRRIENNQVAMVSPWSM